MKRFLKNTIPLLILLLGFSISGYSQSVWIPENHNESQVGLELKIPSFDDGLGFEAPSSSFYLYSHIPLNEHIALQLDLPVSHVSVTGDSETAIGNPYIGIQSGINADLKFDLGIRAPLAPEEAGISTGFLTENYKIGAFFPNAFSVIANVHYRHQYTSGFGFRIDGGTEVLVPEDADGELFIKYGGQLFYTADRLTIGTGLIGRLLATDENLSFSERSINSLGVNGSYRLDSINLGAYVELPLNDDTSIFSLGENALNAIIGLNIGIQI